MKVLSKWVGVFSYDESSPSCLVRDYDVTSVNQYGGISSRPTKGKPVGRLSKRGYWEASYMQFLYKVHRVVWEIHYGEIPDDMYIDHLDGDKSNNKLNNLRLVTKSLNSRNSKAPSTNTTGIAGVSHSKDKGGNVRGYRATWTDLAGRKRNKLFSISMYGEELAELLASEYRQHQIDLLNLMGAGYTERHGRFE